MSSQDDTTPEPQYPDPRAQGGPPGAGQAPPQPGVPPGQQGYATAEPPLPPGQAYPVPGQAYPVPGQGYPAPGGQGYPAPEQGYPPPWQGYPPSQPPQYQVPYGTTDAERSLARKRVEARRGLGGHAVAYLVVNLFLVVVWAFSGAGYFWPIWVLAGWGVGLVLNAWDVLFRRPITDDDIERELRRGRGRR